MLYPVEEREVHDHWDRSGRCYICGASATERGKNPPFDTTERNYCWDCFAHEVHGAPYPGDDEIYYDD